MSETQQVSDPQQQIPGPPQQSDPQQASDPKQASAPRQTAETPGAEAAPVKRRDPYFDNAKFMAITLVVLGHLWGQYYQRDELIRTVYTFVYAFHMPLFVFTTGYFSRGFARSTDKARTLIGQVVVPYVIFILLYRAEVWWINGAGFDLNEAFRPHFLMWFLLALLGWRLSAPIWPHLRHPFAVAVAVALVAGSSQVMLDSTTARMLTLLPFFVLGLTITPERLALLRRPAARWYGAAVLAGGLATAMVLAYRYHRHPFEMRWLWWTDGYQAMEVAPLTGMAIRSGMILIGLVLAAAFLAVVPRGHTWFTWLGTGTMYVFLLHGLILKVFDYLGLLTASPLLNPIGVVALTLLCVAATIVLATEPVRRVTRWAVEPNVSWLLRRSTDR
ncbi:acyltransferase family protein [Actinomadura scrupuli]|uniref:acyltransferase family protein n=1 Tax=Actinomadura scrupuli TaxID=559629 RepID=UPI003D95CB24